MNSPQYSSRAGWDCPPTTPPNGPTITPKTSRRVFEAHETEEIKRIAEVARANPRPPITPPNSPVERRAASSKVSYLNFVPRVSRRANYGVKRYQPMAWILDELEFLVGNFPLTRPQLDSPVIQHIRRKIMNSTRSSSADPQFSSYSLPHSRYSLRHRNSGFRSFSSHSLSHINTEGLYSAGICGLCTPSFSSLYSIPSLTGTLPMSATLHALRNVFPHAPNHKLDCIQATFFAFNYVSRVCVSHDVQAPLSAPPVLVHSYCTVTSTAPEKLGQKVYPEPPRSETSWLRPQTPECLDSKISAQRLESLTVSLNELFRKLLNEIDERRPGTGDDVLARAVLEMIRLGECDGEEVEAGAEVREGARRASCGGSLERGYGWGYPQEWVAQ